MPLPTIPVRVPVAALALALAAAPLCAQAPLTEGLATLVRWDEHFVRDSQLHRVNAVPIASATLDRTRLFRIPHARLRAGGVVVVALSARDSVALFDPHTLDRVATLPVGRNPHEVAASVDGKRAYVADAGDTSITVVEVAPPRVAATWFLPDSLRVHDVSPGADGDFVWAVAAQRRLLLQLDARTGAVRRRWALTRDGGWMVEAAGLEGAVIVAHLEGGAITKLYPTTGETRVLEAREGEIEARVTPDGRELWSVNMRSDSISISDARTGRLLARRHAGRVPLRVAFTLDGRTALVVNGGDSTIIAFDVATRARRSVLGVAGGPKVIAVSDDGRRAYVTHPARDLLTVIDVASMTVLRTVAVPGGPDGVAIVEPGLATDRR